MNLHISVKHLQINKTNNFVLMVVAITSIVTVFSLVSIKELLSQSSYHKKVLSEKRKAVSQLKTNLDAVKGLMTQYDVFAQGNPNLIGGQGGPGSPEGDNAKIVLDALPSQYDFPALISSLEKIVKNVNVAPQSISGTDQDQGSDTVVSSGTPSSISMPFSVEVLSSYAGTLALVSDFERSIRPIDITSLELSGSADNMHMTLQATTYYQPAVKFDVGQKEVR